MGQNQRSITLGVCLFPSVQAFAFGLFPVVGWPCLPEFGESGWVVLTRRVGCSFPFLPFPSYLCVTVA